jgi:hypothetical protein
MRELNAAPIHWLELKQVQKPLLGECRLIICWNDPDAMEFARSDYWSPNDVLIQKLTSFSKGDSSQNWGDNPRVFFENWNWPLYQRFEKLVDSGINAYAFGCKTDISISKEKERICKKLNEKIFWIPWGTTLFTKRELLKQIPILRTEFPLDLGWVGSKWGKVGRGNIDAWESKVVPLAKNLEKIGASKFFFAGKGHENPPVSNQFHEIIIKNSRICPIINAPSWVAEKGVQDRFWSVFGCGRFGVCDSEGVLDFFDSDEVVYSTESIDYIDKSLYFYKNPERQLPFIERIQSRIKEEYNFYDTWKKIIYKINRDLNFSGSKNINSIENSKYYKRLLLRKELVFSEKCIVLGNGPSLAGVDIKEVSKYPTISFNRAYIAYSEWNFSPTYYMVIDPRVLENCATDINNLIKNFHSTTFFLRNLTGLESWNKNKFVTKDFFIDAENVVIFDTNDEPRRFNSPVSFDKLIYWGDVAVCSLQFLYLLGYKKILLLGCDCNYVEKDISGVEKVGIEYRSFSDSDPNHFRPDYFGKGTVYSHPNRQGHLSSWKQVAKDIKKLKEMQVYSGSSISTLNDVIFKYQSFEDFKFI